MVLLIVEEGRVFGETGLDEMVLALDEDFACVIDNLYVRQAEEVLSGEEQLSLFLSIGEVEVELSREFRDNLLESRDEHLAHHSRHVDENDWFTRSAGNLARVPDWFKEEGGIISALE